MQTIVNQRGLPFKFLTSLLRFRSAWFANYALQPVAWGRPSRSGSKFVHQYQRAKMPSCQSMIRDACNLMKIRASVFLGVLAALLVTGCRSTNTGAAREVPERWIFAFDSREWELGDQSADHQTAIREYVLRGQTVQNWSELVTSLYMKGDVALRDQFEQYRRGLSRDCPSLRLSIIDESVQSLIFEWQMDGCEGQPAQHEIRRFTRVKTGILSLSFVEKTRELSAEKRATWISIIKAANVRPDA